MSIRKKPFIDGLYYHVYNRGNNKQEIFHDEEDYFRFICLLFACNSTNNLRAFNFLRKDKSFFIREGEPIVSIGAYVLMPNHFHILITQNKEGGISKFMQKVNTAYAMYYNQKYDHTGGLFEGKFKAIYADNDRYLKYLFSYIHLNPIKLIQKDWKEKGIKNEQKALNFLEEYKYSSFIDYNEEKRPQNSILNRDAFPDYFSNQNSFLKEVFDWLKYSE